MLPFWHSTLAHPVPDPHPEAVAHADESEEEEDPDTLEEVGVEGEVERRRKEDGSDQLPLCRHEARPEQWFYAKIRFPYIKLHLTM